MVTAQIPQEILDFARSVADSLSAIPGVRAVVLGGSWARGGADADSDIDMGLYYDPQQPPSLQALRSLVAEIDDRGDGAAVTDFGEWGPWINGGGWLTIRGRHVDWLYRDLGKIRGIVEDCRAGKPFPHYQPGHPHAFYTTIYLGELALCVPLADPYGDIARLKAEVMPYPPLLKRAMIERNLWEAQFTLDNTQKPFQRGDMLVVAGALFRCVADLVQVIYACNEAYCINEKGSLKAAAAMPFCVPDFAARSEQILSHIGSSPADMQAALQRCQILIDDVRALCEAS